MPVSIWLSLKKSLKCKSGPSQVHDPGKKLCSSGCSRSISNLRDVINGSKRHTEKLELANNCSPRSLGSGDALSPLTHEVVFNESTSELKIDTSFGCGDGKKSNHVSISKKIQGQFHDYGGGGGGYLNSPIKSSGNGDSLVCKKCSEKLKSIDDLEEHHISNHAVSELQEGDSSRRIVEIICKTTSINSKSFIERIVKVHNTNTTLSKFEEYRDQVKNKASKLPTKHPRCIADGNELLRFHATSLACSLGVNGSMSLCKLDNCKVCKVLRHGFGAVSEPSPAMSIFTSVDGGKALQGIEAKEEKKALLICRVIAGRVHKPVENFDGGLVQSGFDSVAGKIGLNSQIEELYVLNPKALLPCFVVICKN